MHTPDGLQGNDVCESIQTCDAIQVPDGSFSPCHFDLAKSFTRPYRMRTGGCACGGEERTGHSSSVSVRAAVGTKTELRTGVSIIMATQLIICQEQVYLDTSMSNNDGKPCQDAHPVVCLAGVIDGSTGPSQDESGANSRRQGPVTHP